MKIIPILIVVGLCGTLQAAQNNAPGSYALHEEMTKGSEMKGTDQKAKEFAKRMIEAQKIEIKEFERWLNARPENQGQKK